jgi:death-on-curing family protein
VTQRIESVPGEFRDSGISFDEVLKLYKAILRETGGEYGFVSEGTLRYIVDTLDSVRGDIFAKAAYAMQNIAAKHPLANGNKRLAFALGALILRTQGYDLPTRKDEAVPLMLKVAKGETSKKALESWLRSRSKKI